MKYAEHHECVHQIVGKKAEGGDTTQRSGKRIIIDDFNEKALSRLIMSFYKRSPRELPTLDKILTDSKEIS